MVFGLESGVGITREVEDSLWDTSIPYAIARQGQRYLNEKQSVIAFFEQPSHIFSLSSDNYLVQTARLDRKVIGNWKIGAFNGIELEQELVDLKIQSTNKTEMGDADAGCLLKSPLRYGDIDGDGEKELVIFMGRGWQTDIHIFSTSIKKTIFSANLNVNHAFIPDAKELENIYPTYGKPNHPQYLSDWVNGNPPPLEIGFRSFGKIFLDDIDGDETKDIVLWRKYFVSKKIEDPIKGFDKKSDTYIHYKLIDGEYKKQSTEQNVVKGWLEAKNLTWQKGYPSKSECPGQEGQLILEMHDPLLNDPDVLK